MISSIEVSNFKGFQHLQLSELGPFHVLAGPNGSGKSSFFEILEFIKDLLLFDVQEALSRRNVSSARQLTFRERGGHIKFQLTLDPSLFDGETVVYQVWLLESAESGLGIAHEYLRKSTSSSRPFLSRTNGSAGYAREDESQTDYFSFPPTRTFLGQVPPDEKRYRTANLVKKLLTSGVHTLGLNGGRMGVPCLPTGSLEDLLPTGNNLPVVAGRLLSGRGDEWIYHLRLALEDLKDISWRRQDDGSEYLRLRYQNGLEIPSWLASWGTLRTLALTLPAFLPSDEPTLYLFEEPENGIHPKAIEVVMSAIQSIPHAQTFVTTHSPMIVQQSGVDALLLFSKADGGITVQHGNDNQTLRDLNGVPDLATVFSSRVLG